MIVGPAKFYFKQNNYLKMEMNLGSAIIGAIAIAICVLPFVIINRSNKKRKDVLLQGLTKLAAEHGRQLSQYELFAHFGIGIDKQQNFICFYKAMKDQSLEKCIDLNEIQSCKLLQSTRTIKQQEGSHNVIDRLELSFVSKLKQQAETRLEFFNIDENPELFGELQAIEKWSKIINAQLKLK